MEDRGRLDGPQGWSRCFADDKNILPFLGVEQ